MTTQSEKIEALTSALGRTEANLIAAIRGLPVRDLAECLAENAAAFDSIPEDTPECICPIDWDHRCPLHGEVAQT